MWDYPPTKINAKTPHTPAVTGNTKKEEPVCIYFAFVRLKRVVK